MTVVDPIAPSNPNFLVDQLNQLKQFVQQAARNAQPLREFETNLLTTLVKIGSDCVTEFLRLQGDGDLGPTIETTDGRLIRSDKPHPRQLRSLFGEHVFRYRSDLAEELGQRIRASSDLPVRFYDVHAVHKLLISKRA